MTFADALQRRGIQYRRNSNDPHWYHICCLFCAERGFEPDSKFRLGINTQTGATRCFHCGYRTKNGTYWVLRKLELNPADYEARIPEQQPHTAPPALPTDFMLLTEAEDERDWAARDYALQRGISGQQIQAHRIGVSYSGKYAYRVIFPIFASRGVPNPSGGSLPSDAPRRFVLGPATGHKTEFNNPRLLGFTARDFTGHREPRYLNSSGEKYLYNWNPSAEQVVIAEGPIKALRIERVCGTGAALLGHTLTEQQLQQVMESKAQHIVIWPDPNLVGRRGAIKVAEQLISEWKGQVSIIWPAPVPADDASWGEIKQRLSQPTPYSFSLRQAMTIG